MPVRLEEIRRLITLRELKAALSALDALPPLEGVAQQERIRLTALAQSGLGMTEQALSSLESTLDSDHVQIEDLYFAGERALESQDMRKALDYLSRAISASVVAGDIYYLSVSYLLRAYVHIKNGDLLSARRDLNEIADDDCSVTWLSNMPHILKKDLLTLVAPSRP